MRSIPLGLTYDDVLLVPRFSSLRSRRDVDIATKFTRQIALRTPFVSANMDTVTTARMAIAIAEFGGIGVVHRFMPISAEVSEVTKVKRHHPPVIEDPQVVSPDATIGDARRLMGQLNISGLPVVWEGGQLVGILTHRDVQMAENETSVSEHMTQSEYLVVGPADISLDEARLTLSRRRLEKLPLVDDSGRLVGLITSKDLWESQDLNRAARDNEGRLRVAAAVGIVGDYLERAEALVEAGVDALVLDVAHGESSIMLTAIHQVRERLGNVPLVAGNVATPEGTKRLIDAGVDAVKIGVGPGSLCTTRQVAGAGVPQFTAVLQCAEVARECEVPVIADGGIRNSGDAAKAIGGGASTVMVGDLLAGTDESPGMVVHRDGRKFKVARGMASAEAAADRVQREDPTRGWAGWDMVEPDVAPEGVQTLVLYRGSAREALEQLAAGLRSGMSYSDALDIGEMWKNASFVRQTEAGRRESGPHGAGA